MGFKAGGAFNGDEISSGEGVYQWPTWQEPIWQQVMGWQKSGEMTRHRIYYTIMFGIMSFILHDLVIGIFCIVVMIKGILRSDTIKASTLAREAELRELKETAKKLQAIGLMNMYGATGGGANVTITPPQPMPVPMPISYLNPAMQPQPVPFMQPQPITIQSTDTAQPLTAIPESLSELQSSSSSAQPMTIVQNEPTETDGLIERTQSGNHIYPTV